MASAIRSTIARIELNTSKKVLRKWQELYPETEPAALVVATINVSEIPIDDRQAALPTLHLGLHDRHWLHGPHEAIQQSRIKL